MMFGTVIGEGLLLTSLRLTASSALAAELIAYSSLDSADGYNHR
jgi:hypothetical protein